MSWLCCQEVFFKFFQVVEGEEKERRETVYTTHWDSCNSVCISNLKVVGIINGFDGRVVHWRAAKPNIEQIANRLLSIFLFRVVNPTSFKSFLSNQVRHQNNAQCTVKYCQDSWRERQCTDADPGTCLVEGHDRCGGERSSCRGSEVPRTVGT